MTILTISFKNVVNRLHAQACAHTNIFFIVLNMKTKSRMKETISIRVRIKEIGNKKAIKSREKSTKPNNKTKIFEKDSKNWFT